MTERTSENRTGLKLHLLAAAGTMVGALLVALTSCDRSPATLLRANQEPTLELEPLRASGGQGARLLRVAWHGEDADGKVTHFEWSLGPEAALGRESWTETNERERTIDLGSQPPDATGTRTLRFLSVRSVDDLGAKSPVRRVGFYGDNIPPEIRLTSPPPSSFPFLVSSTVTFRWDGSDPDGASTQEPVEYKYILLSSSSEFPHWLALSNPDSLRTYYANHPLGPWAGWDSTAADTTRFTNLIAGDFYVFCVIAFDEAGDYSPVFSFTTNMTRIRVGFGEVQVGPRMGVFNESFNYEYTLPGIGTGYAIPLETPAETPVTFNWYAIPSLGTKVTGYRWALDIEDIFDETPRNGPDDLQHWSEWNLGVTSATVGPFVTASLKRGRHNFYIEAGDNLGNISLAQIEIVVVPAIPLPDRRELLIVDDTRFRGDAFAAGQSCPLSPSVPWPMAAELDTALYARGGVPWRCKPAGTLSQPGLFAGYSFDTLGTRGLDTRGIPYSVLSQYRRIIWLIDNTGAGNDKPPTDPVDPTTLLRLVSGQGRYNSLAAFIEQGGSVWIAGGGAGYASTDPYNDRNNDAGSKIYSSITGRNELVPGRFAWEFGHWRSEFSIARPVVTFPRSLGRNEADPRYAGLPSLLQLRTAATDPWPPPRPYSAVASIEYLRVDNQILEDIGGKLTSVLDTLYRVTGSPNLLDPDPLPPNYIVMTHYHGSESGPVTFSGFGLWDIRYSQMRPVVDFVLQQLWGMTPVSPASAPVSARARGN